VRSKRPFALDRQLAAVKCGYEGARGPMLRAEQEAVRGGHGGNSRRTSARDLGVRRRRDRVSRDSGRHVPGLTGDVPAAK